MRKGVTRLLQEVDRLLTYEVTVITRGGKSTKHTVIAHDESEIRWQFRNFNYEDRLQIRLIGNAPKSYIQNREG